MTSPFLVLRQLFHFLTGFICLITFSLVHSPKKVNTVKSRLTLIFSYFFKYFQDYARIPKYKSTITPNTMRYQPNILKSCFLIYPIRKRRIKTDTINATAVPIRRSISSRLVKSNPNFTTFRRLAPNITGIARKNVYSAATVLETPISNAPTMVAPEREVPGKIAAIN